MLPLLDAMQLPRASAAEKAQRFFAFFYPNGRDPGRWDPPAGALTVNSLPLSLKDLEGFGAEGIWPKSPATLENVTVVTGIDHSQIARQIHTPSMSLTAHRAGANDWEATAPTLDQYLADKIRGETPFRTLTMSATSEKDISQGCISWVSAGQVAAVERSPTLLFDQLFSGVTGQDNAAAERIRLRRASVLDFVLEDAKRLQMRLGAADRQRLEQYFEAIAELEKQLQPGATCDAPSAPADGGNWHSKAKSFMDLAVLAMACDLTRVATLQYSHSWGVNYTDYQLGSGDESVGKWSDHLISHKLGDADRATDLDSLDAADARRIADARVVLTARFKVRRFAYLINKLKEISTPTGSLLDETMAMYCSENGDGDSHSRKNMPFLLAGGVGGMKGGRCIVAGGAPTGALHGAIIKKFGLPVDSYGDPASSPLAGI